MVVVELGVGKEEYMERRDWPGIVMSVEDSIEFATAPDSCCNTFGGFESFSALGKYQGDSAYHAWYPLACELWPQGPIQHFDWWVKNMRELADKLDHRPAVWIPATASPVMVEVAFEALGRNADYVVSDLCETPLKVIKKRFGSYVHTYRSDIFQPNYDLWRGWLSGGFDIIATDAFITRFPEAQVVEILNTFRVALSDQGKILTTIRHPKPTETSAEQETEEASLIQQYPMASLNRWREFRARHAASFTMDISDELVMELATEYAQHMKSRHGKNDDMENKLDNARLSLAVFHEVRLPDIHGLANNVVPVLKSGLKIDDLQISGMCTDISDRRYELLTLTKNFELTSS